MEDGFGYWITAWVISLLLAFALGYGLGRREPPFDDESRGPDGRPGGEWID